MPNKSYQREYAKLNPEQKEAVDTIEGPVMVIAGPGTGKTQIIAMRIANILLKTQVNPANILCLTFTNSGVAAMKNRLLEIIGAPSYQIHVHTFHSFCNEIINTYPEYFLTAEKINQLSDLEQIQVIQSLLTAGDYKYIKPFKSPFYYQGAINSAIGSLKQENISPDQFEHIAQNELKTFNSTADLYHDKGTSKGKMKAKYERIQTEILRNIELSNLYRGYQNNLLETGKYDYADMILWVLGAFKSNQEILSVYQEKYQYILTDEYQDTNTAQNSILSILGSFYDQPNIFVVGDDEQSVFRFQGASLENILEFKNHYPDAKIFVLESNYRSNQKILDASRELISVNQNQLSQAMAISKQLKSQRTDLAGDIEVGQFSNGSVESFFVASKIKELMAKKVDPNKIAVIYREHRDSDELIDFLSKLKIPYVIEAGSNILEDPEINKILTYLKALNFGIKSIDNQLILEILHYPFFGISPLDIYKIVVAANQKRLNLFDIISSTKHLRELDLDTNDAIAEFVEIFLNCRREGHVSNFSHSFEYIINVSGYLGYLLSLSDSAHHLNRLQILFSEIKLLNIKNKNLRLDQFLGYLSLLEENNIKIPDQEIAADFNGVHLMTAHKSKGLEFEYVFIIHLTDKHWGNKVRRDLIKLPLGVLKTTAPKNPEENGGDEEERRLFYVSLTRAKKHIFLTSSASYGSDENSRLSIPSKFVAEISHKYLTKIQVSNFEKQFDERLRLTFAEKKWQPSDEMNKFLETLIKDFKLSPTSLNSYLECPQRFFYDNILRIPKTKDFSQSYGTAVHKALELLFKKYKRDYAVPSKADFLKDFENALVNEIFTETDLGRAKKQGRDILNKYYDFYVDDWKKHGIPLSCEFDFSRDNVFYNDIPITGKIDRIDMIDQLSGRVRIIDYKTSRPKSQNQLLGLTKNADTSYLYQAYFYKLLAETDPLFNWQVGDIEFDFISPENNVFKKVSLPVDKKQYTDFKNVVEKVYDKICNLQFHLENQACKKGDGKCIYFNICHNETNTKKKFQR